MTEHLEEELKRLAAIGVEAVETILQSVREAFAQSFNSTNSDKRRSLAMREDASRFPLIVDTDVALLSRPLVGQLFAAETETSHGDEPDPDTDAVNALNVAVDRLLDRAQRATEMAKARGDEIDAVLAEIRQIRAETPAA